ncbi:MAG: response regulator transcription factor [Clostridia bacterium]|nr:response regulator transcription factor [Clostridia bacterium]
MIFCVDDDSTIRDLEVYTLEQMGLKAKGFADGKALLCALKSEKPQLIILDIMMPEIDGLEILRQIRSNSETKKIPVIMATAKGTEMDKIGGLDSGADDYLVKPFSMMEMVSRVKAVLRRSEPANDGEELVIGDIVLNDKEHIVKVLGERITLTLKEYDMLKFFLRNKGVVFSRDTLLNEVWGIDYLGESRTVDMHIKTLRKKLGEAGRYIETVIGVGYKLEEKK